MRKGRRHLLESIPQAYTSQSPPGLVLTTFAMSAPIVTGVMKAFPDESS
jgi:hypothetical protein